MVVANNRFIAALPVNAQVAGAGIIVITGENSNFIRIFTSLAIRCSYPVSARLIDRNVCAIV